MVSFAKDKHPDGASSLIIATAGWFRNVPNHRRLRTDCRVALSDEVEDNPNLRARVEQELCLREGRPIQWVKGSRECFMSGSMRSSHCLMSRGS